MSHMVSLVVTGPGEHGFQATPRPVLPADHVRVRVAAVAFCGTDFKLFGGHMHDARYPVVPGHEWSGHVVEAPTAPELVGEHVVASIYSPCDECRWCAIGESQHCTRLAEYGFTLPGGCAEEIVVRRCNVRVVPAGVTPAAACLLEPLTVVIHALDRAPDLARRTVVVLGGGAIGLLLLQLIRAAGATCTVVEPTAARRALAASLGGRVAGSATELAENSADVVFDATGSAASLGQGVRLVVPTGTLLLVGYSGEEHARFMPSSLMLKEVTIRGVLSGFGTLDRAIDIIARRTVQLDPLISPPIQFEDYATLLACGAADRAPRQPMLVSQLASDWR